jgi:hypothetical protein
MSKQSRQRGPRWKGQGQSHWRLAGDDCLKRRKRRHTSQSKRFANFYAGLVVAKRMECGAFRRFGFDFVTGPAFAAYRQK